MKKLGTPEKGAVSKLRKLYLERKEKPLTQEQLKELKDTFGKKSPANKNEKKIAKGDRDLESP